MNNRHTVRAVEAPADSWLQPSLKNANFHDAFEVGVTDGMRSALYWYLHFASKTPDWIDNLMTLRNRVVSLFGLKNLGTLSAVPPPPAAAHLRVGDLVGIFTIVYLSDQEVVLEDRDRHLDVRVSVYIKNGSAPTVTLTTVVRIHNTLGWFYMLPVVPMHKLIVRRILHDS